MNGLKPSKEALGLWRQELQGTEGKEVMPGTYTPSTQKIERGHLSVLTLMIICPLRSSQPLEE